MNEPVLRDGKIVRSEEPLNLEMPFSTLKEFATPTESFYVRTHFPIPKIDPAKWRLRIEGEVERPFEICYDELVDLESLTMPITLECAGNNRIFLEPKVKGVQWELGAVGTAEWTGVLLALLLERAGVKQTAREVILEGADKGAVPEAKGHGDCVRFARSIPLAKACADVLLVHKMNGQALLPQHGFPVRAIVPGWYAMASIKWLQRAIVTSTPFHGYYQTLDYAYWSQVDGRAELIPLSTMQLKAEIAFPTNGSDVARGSKVRIFGAAWGGDVAKVEVSVDGGKEWQMAQLLDDPNPDAWRRWDFQWNAPERGNYILMARAIDSNGRTQPAQRDSSRGTYMIDHLLPIAVRVVD